MNKLYDFSYYVARGRIGTVIMESLILNPYIIALILVWVLPWKGVALWKAARSHQKGWFIVLLVINTMAILDIIYIFFIANKQSLEIEERPDITPQV